VLDFQLSINLVTGERAIRAMSLEILALILRACMWMPSAAETHRRKQQHC